MKTVRVQVEGNVITDKILNGFALITKGQGYEDYPSQYEAGIGAGHDGILTVRTYNGTWAKRIGGAWVDMTPTRTFNVGTDIVNEYVGFDNVGIVDRSYLFSRSTTRIEFTTDGTYIFPWFNMNDNAIIVHTKITPGIWLNTACGWFYAGRQLFSEPVSVAEWADMVDVTTPPAEETTINKQVRLPENIYGNIVDFGVALTKILSVRSTVAIYVYGYPNLNGTIAEAFNYAAQRVSAGKKATLNFPYVHTDDVLNNVQVTFDGEGGYTYEQENL